MEILTGDILKLLITFLVGLLVYIWTTTLKRLKEEWTLIFKGIQADIKEIENNLKDIKTALGKHDKRLDDLERFRVALTTIHNINHPNTKINGLGSNGTVSKP